MYKILAVNPGSTSTKIALYEDETELFSKNIKLDPEQIKGFSCVQEQLEYRRKQVEDTLAANGVALSEIDIFCARGGGLVPSEGGIYELNERLVKDAASHVKDAQHPAQLASQICKHFADLYGKKAYTLSVPDVDEMDLIARITGVKGLYRESKAHTLNQKEVALRHCKAIGRKYEDMNFVIAHIGGGATVTAHRKGRMIDTNSAIHGEGPMSPTRAGTLPFIKAFSLACNFSGSEEELVTKMNSRSGLLDHLGTDDAIEIEKRIASGDTYAKIVYEAMIYQISKYIGYYAVALKGKIDAILITGGIAHNAHVTDMIKDYCSWIAPVFVYAGEFEMEALVSGALRAVRGEEEVKVYTGIPVWNGFEGIETI